MPRPTKAEIRSEIVDKAAGLFARYGFDETSLQSIADAVRYTKAGLLNHFPSKQAIYDAALSAVSTEMRDLGARVGAFENGAARDRALCEEIVDLTYKWPGLSALGLSFVHRDTLEHPDAIAAGAAIFEAFGIDPMLTSNDRLIRMMVAVGGLGMAAMTAYQLDLKREWRPVMISAAMEALGYSIGNA